MNHRKSAKIVPRLVFIGGLLSFSALSVTLAFGAWRLNWAASAARRAAANLEACRNFADEIIALRQRPEQAGLTELGDTQLTRAIEAAASSGKIASEHLTRIEPRSVTRWGETDYKQQATVVELQSVTLEQLVVFLCEVLAAKPGLQLERLRIQAPRYVASEPTGEENWHVEAVLTYLFFAPTIPALGV